MPGAPLDHGALTQEVLNLKEGHGELRKEFRMLDGKVDAGFSLLASKIDAGRKIEWTPISIMVSALLAIGAALYYPVREAISESKAQTETARRENEARIIKLWDATSATSRELEYLKGQLHPLQKP